MSTLEAADAAYQEWPRWLRSGTIDYVIPMAYTDQMSDLSRQIAQWKTVDPSLQRIIPGLSIYQDDGGKNVTRNLDLIRHQRSLCRQQGAHGNMFFSMEYLSDPLARRLPHRVLPYPSPSVPSPATFAVTQAKNTGEFLA